MRTYCRSLHSQGTRWPRLRRLRQCTQAEHRLGIQAYRKAQRSTALACVRVGMLDEEVAAHAHVSLAQIDAWFVADGAFWNARREFRDTALATIREAAKTELEARQWLVERGIPLERP